MGYNSQVLLVINKEKFHKYEQEFKKCIQDCDTISETEDAYQFAWDCVKWYEGYDDVDAVDNLLSELDEEDYGFIRIGEELNDVETKGCPWHFEAEVCRSIEYDDSKSISHEKFFAPNSVKFIREDK